MLQHLLLLLPISLCLAKNEHRKKILIAVFLILYAFSAIRYDFGNDYLSYMDKYNTIQQGGNPYSTEVLSTLLFKICPNYYVLIAISSIFYLAATYFLIKEDVNEQYYWIAVMIFIINPYLFFQSLSALRQYWATAFFMVAVRFSYKRKLLWYVFFVLVATLFHKSAIVLLPVYLIANDRAVTVKQICVFAGLVCFAVLFSQRVFDEILLKLAALFRDINYEVYLSHSGRNSLRATILTGITFVYLVVNIPYLKGKTLLYAKLYCISITFGVLAYKMAMLTRLQIYFDVFGIVALPLIAVQRFKELKEQAKDGGKWKKIWFLGVGIGLPLLIVLVFYLRYYSYFTNPLWQRFFDYKTIFDLL